MRVLLVVFFLLISGCGKSALEPLHSDDVIVAFGDSLTAGYGVPNSSAYPVVLSELTGLTVINAGVSGETTEEGLNRLPEVIISENPALIILFEGGNDILRNHDLSKTKQNLAAMIQIAKEQEIQVALVGLPRKQLFSSTAEFYRELADEYKIPLQDDIVASLLRKPAMKSDNVHFNVKGYRALAEAVADMLKEAGAIK